MANHVFVLFMTVFVALFVHNSATQITILDGFKGVEQCDVVCATAFAGIKVRCVACIVC